MVLASEHLSHEPSFLVQWDYQNIRNINSVLNIDVVLDFVPVRLLWFILFTREEIINL
jgi:hypothetical protein